MSPIDCTVLFCCRGTDDGRAGGPKDQVQAAVPQPQQRVFKEAAALPVTNAPLKIVSPNAFVPNYDDNTLLTRAVEVLLGRENN